MRKRPARTLRDLCIAAREGDPAAARALLRREGNDKLAAEIHRDRPFPPRVTKMIAALTAGIGTREELGEWEFRNDAGEIENDLLSDLSTARSKQAPLDGD